MGASKPKKQTIGFKYRLSVHLALCHGEVTFKKVKFADKVAWSGSLAPRTNSHLLQVSQLQLFGGEKSEGGVSGIFEFANGGMRQEMERVQDDGTYSKGNLYLHLPGMTDLEKGALALALLISGNRDGGSPPKATHMRGLAMVNLWNCYIGTSPYLKDISVEVERVWQGWEPQWSRVGKDMNPAHIIYETCVNDQWGLGYDPDLLDQTSFRESARTLYNEGFGMSILWQEQSTVEDFIDEVLQHIDGDFFYDQDLGKWRLKLVRASDPVVQRLGPHNCQLTSFTRKGTGETINQLYVKYVSRETEEFVSVAIQNLADIESQGQTASSTKEYRGIREEALALRVCQRDLQTLSSSLATAEMVANRTAWNRNPGDVVELSWPALGIQSLRMRVRSTEQGDSEDGSIKLSLIEDVFGKVNAVFGGGSAPNVDAGRLPPTKYSAVSAWEVPYWFIYNALGAENIDPLFGVAALSAVTNNLGFQSVALQYWDTSLTTPTWVDVASGAITPSALLSTALTRESWGKIRINLASYQSPVVGAALPMDCLLLIGEGMNAEIAQIRGTGEGPEFTVYRGLMDTQPRQWPVGTRVYFISEDAFTSDETARSIGTVAQYRLGMQTSVGRTKQEDMQTASLPIRGRQGRPYPPANVRINGELWPDEIDASSNGMVVVSWSTRNRLLQNTPEHLLWDAASITPEPGTTYDGELLQNGTVIASFSGAVVPEQALSLQNATTGPITLRLYSVRGDLTSYQVFTHEFLAQMEDTAPDWPAVPFPGRRLVLVGDSITYQNTQYVEPNAAGRYKAYAYGALGYWTYAAQLAGHRLEFEPGIQPDYNGRDMGLNLGIAGSRVMNWWSPSFDNQDNGVFDVGPMYAALNAINDFDVAVVMGGTNDLSFNRSVSQVLGGLKRAIGDLASQGKWVFACTITPRSIDLLQGYTLEQMAVIRSRLLQVNQGLRDWIADASPANVFLVDAFAATVGPNGLDPSGWVSSTTDPAEPSTVGNFRPEAPGVRFMHDGLHPASAGAYAIGKALAAAMITAGVPARSGTNLGPLTLGPNIIPNPTFTRTTARPPSGLSNRLGRAIGLGPALTNSTHAAGPQVIGNVGLGYLFGQVPDYWFFYRASNLDNESYSNFNAYLFGDLAAEAPELVPYTQESTWTDGSATMAVTTVDGKPALRIDFRTPVTGNKNEAFVVRTFLPEGQAGPWDDWAAGVVPNTVYAAGDKLTAEAEIRMSNIKGLYYAGMTMDILSVDKAATDEGDFSTSGAVISSIANSMNVFPFANIDQVRSHPEDFSGVMHIPSIVVPERPANEDQRYARLNFQFALDASRENASVTVFIIAPSINKVTNSLPVGPTPTGLGLELGKYLGGTV